MSLSRRWLTTSPTRTKYVSLGWGSLTLGGIRPLASSVGAGGYGVTDMSETYCHLCDADPCYCGQHGQVAYVQHKTFERGAPKGMDAAVREFVLSSHEAGVRENWTGWLNRIVEQFGEEDAPRPVWNRVSNDLQREWLLISHPAHDGPMMPPASYPDVRRLSLPDAIAEVERLIDSGGWAAGEKGLRLWQVVERIGDVLYISIYEALHDMNGRNRRVTTMSPGGNPSQFWYVRSELPTSGAS